MRTDYKMIDFVQAIGFIMSAFISLWMIKSGQDTTQSVILGIVLAIFVQLFDLQIRNNKAEQKILQYKTLSIRLYEDKKLYDQISNIVNDYFNIKSQWYQPFRDHAEELVYNCMESLQSLSKGVLTTPRPGPYSIGVESFGMAKKSIKIVSTDHISKFFKARTPQYLNAYKELTKRGVDVKQIYIQPKETYETDFVKEFLKNHAEAGVNVYIRHSESTKPELKEHFILIDDKLLTKVLFTSDGTVYAENISIDKTDIQKMMNKFELLLRHAEEFTS